ncbi:MAG: anaerobic glycerol-3-phosphate dehydrogenase subunit C [Planctomycetota bacterium]|nr:MAG: anaerobic glycerol-3-phosphate dehydrogenase subunit C [Planctomycetota bacterium]
MDEQQQRISEDLAGSFAGELRFDPLTLNMYATDASLYQLRPLGVAYPRHRADVVALARYAGEQDLPLVPRGAGSGVAGGAVGRGLVIDFSRHMTEIERVDESTVRVQAGVVLDRLNQRLREYGRYFPPDPSNSAVTTVGGMLGVDAAGSHAVRVGSTRDHVESIELVLAGGDCFEAGLEAVSPGLADAGGNGARLRDAGQGDEASRMQAVRRTATSRLGHLLRENAELIHARQPPLMRNCSGYHLRSALVHDAVSFPRLLVGSEGTLALFTAATLNTAPLPAQRGVVLLLFAQNESAIRTVQDVIQQQPSACDLLDRRILSIARDSDPRFAAMIPPAAEAGLIVEQTGFNERQTKDRLRMIIDAARHRDSRVVVGAQAYEFDDVEFLWTLPKRVVPLLARLRKGARPVPLVEDIAVPPEALNEFLVKAQKVLQRHQLTASLYAHAASGQVHLRPFLPLPDESDAGRIEALARDVYEVVFSVGGSMSGEKGDGLSRTAFIRSQYGPLYRVFQQVKEIFDPHNLLNPGKIISNDQHATIRHFRPTEQADPPVIPLQLNWRSESMLETAALCNGCGTCRTQEPLVRMCPFFRIDPVEEASPRAKANVMRGFATAALDASDMTSESMQRLASLCFNCKQCRDECPSGVDIPHLVLEAKAGYVAANGLRRADWFLARAHSYGRIGCALAPLTNRAVNNSLARWLMERLIGIARRRKLPTFARRPFLKRLDSNRTDPAKLTRTPQSIVYFVDGYVNHHDPELGEAFLAILDHHEIPVHVPLEQTGSGMALISAGDLAVARKTAQLNVRVLSELARDGHPIVCTEPTSALCLREEYPMLLDHPDVDVVARQVTDAGGFLGKLHAEGRLKTDFQPLDLTVGYHLPCHVKALSRGAPYVELLNLIPGLTVNRIQEGCSGMAGAFGLTRDNFETSLEIGAGLIHRMQRSDVTVGATDCSSCKLQMEQGTTTPTIHPIKLLALAYGLMPQLRERLSPSGKRLVVT